MSDVRNWPTGIGSIVVLTCCACGWLSCSTTGDRPSGPQTRTERVTFDRDVQPILSENCFACHGPDEEARKRDLRLDTQEGLFGETREGFPIIAPGHPEESEIMFRVTHEDAEERMPPADSTFALDPEEIATIETWIRQGADYEPHWAFIAPQRYPAPHVRHANRPQDAIDAFILARLEETGLSPSPEADKRTLIRRLSYDLRGLPPTREEVEAFLADDSRGAYERVVDRFLASPHYGERMALAWMDRSRYADTNGYSIDGGRHMWLWRDWVIQAFNDDKPYDEFILEQLAGDLLEDATDQQIVATGFNRNHMITHEGGTIPEENLANYCVDRVKTTAEVFLGLTMGCAQCHDHKYDPISQKEYYEFYAYFNALGDRGLDGNSGRNAVPSITTTTALRHDDVEAVIARIEELKAGLASPRPAMQAEWEAEQRAELARRGENLAFHELRPISAKSTNLDPTRITILDDGSIFARGHFPEAYTISLELIEDSPPITGLRVEFYPHPDVEDGSIGYGRGDNVGTLGINAVSVSAGALPSDELDLVAFRPLAGATASYSHAEFPARSVLDPSPSTAWSPLGRDKEPQHLTVTFAEPVDSAASPYFTTMMVFVNRDTGLSSPGHFRIRAFSGRDDGTELPKDIQEILYITPAERSADQRERIRWYHAAENPKLAPLRVELHNLERRHAEMTKPFSTLVMNTADDPRETHVLIRGQYDQLGEKVVPGTPSVLPPLPEGAPANRLGLAEWLLEPAHPLTSRVAVNMLWQLVFGTGLVATPADFGTQGERPSHPELLDTLAVEFVEDGWSVKRIMKRLVMSRTYRQSSRVRPESLAVDPNNRLLSYSPRYRLPAEFIRDSALRVSGLLVPWVGGSSVKPYQPEHLWREVSHYGSSPATAQVFTRDDGMALYRRSLYTYWKRTLPPPAMMAFDAPNRELCTLNRSRTNTPTQALVLLNDPQFVEASRAFAERVMLELPEASMRDRLRYAFEETTGRPPSGHELDTLERAYDRQHAAFADRPADAARVLSIGEHPVNAELDIVDQAAMTMLSSILFNLSEVVTRS